MAHFFDTLTEMAEMTIFFLLGLLVTPARLPQMLLPSLGTHGVYALCEPPHRRRRAPSAL